MAAMELSGELQTEHVQFPAHTRLMDEIAMEVRETAGQQELTDAQVAEKVETILLDKIKDGDKSANFQLGLLYFHQDQFDKAKSLFERSKDYDYQSLFMYGIMKYDGLGMEVDMRDGIKCMIQITSSESRLCKHLVPAARYNIGRAYFQGYGGQQSDTEAEKWWLLAADDGNPKASIKAQSILGMYYSRQDKQCQDLKKAFFWHSEACGNGSLESQGALGVMYMFGLGVRKDNDAAYICLKEASERGNVYAMGNLVALFYKSKLYTKACDLGYKVSQLSEEDVPVLAAETDCLPLYIAKGIAMACFIYARCLVGGHSLKPNKELAKTYYSKSYKFDPDVCALLQHTTQQGAL
ncbi:LRP2-binding protein [Aplysia californica]|uniref:LRP2-binding protein n=1 Tax=Aplysia californica TaxID=6500 RepID=A0ABM0JK60_APLCA|nr:LRP2-binding protein [Aplysia californica]